MIKLARFRASLQVICGNGLDGPGLPGFRFSIGNGFGGGDGLNYGRRRQNFGSRLTGFLDRIGIHVVAVNVGNQNEVCLRES